MVKLTVVKGNAHVLIETCSSSHIRKDTTRMKAHDLHLVYRRVFRNLL